MNPKPFQRRIAIVLLAIFLPSLFPVNLLYANNNGPTSPEATSFEPVDATDMVNLLTGQYSYVLPLLNVPSPEGGYPLALSYHAGLAMDQEASWTGIGWNVNAGAINRNVNGYPDDYNASQLNEFFYDHEQTQTYYSLSLGFSAHGAWSVGTGFNWGSHQALGGHVSVGVGFKIEGVGKGGVNATVGTNGSSLGVGVGFNGGLSLGANINSDGKGSISAGYTNTNGSGFSVSSNGAYSLDFGIGKGNSLSIDGSSNGLGVSLKSYKINGSKAVGGVGVGLSMSFNNTISMGDYSTSTSGWMIPIIIPTKIGIFSLTFGKQTFKYWLSKNKNNYVTGPVHFGKGVKNIPVYNLIKRDHCISYGNYGSCDGWVVCPSINGQPCEFITNNSEPHSNYEITSYDKAFMDINETTFLTNNITDNISVTENNLVLPNYDDFNVQAQGLSGSIAATHLENGVLFGMDGNENKEGYKLIYNNNHLVDIKQGFSNQLPFFYFENEISSYLNTTDVNEMTFNTATNYGSIFDYGNKTNVSADAKPRRKTANYIQYFTNEELASTTPATIQQLKNKGYLKPNTQIDRNQFSKDGIGAFQITAVDGKTYHYSLPVYNHEIITRTFGVISGRSESQSYMEKRQLDAYATHWVLTAVTGSDFIDNGDDSVGNGDTGYWVSFEYGKWTDAFVWKAPYDKDYFVDDKDPNIKTWIRGRKELYYLDKIKTRTHTAAFVKSERIDASSQGWSYNSVEHKDNATGSYANRFTIPSQNQLRLDKILLYKNEDEVLNPYNNGSSIANLGYLHSNKSAISASINCKNKVIDIQDNWAAQMTKAIKVIELDYSYINRYGKQTLNLDKVKFNGKNNSKVLPPYVFTYFNSPTSATSFNDGWGYEEAMPQNHSLKEIITPTGAKIVMGYEINKYKTSVPSILEFSTVDSKYKLSQIAFQGVMINGDWANLNHMTAQIEINNGNNGNYPINIGKQVSIEIYIKRSCNVHNYNVSDYFKASFIAQVTQILDNGKFKIVTINPFPWVSTSNTYCGPRKGFSNWDTIESANAKITFNQYDIFTSGGPRVKTIEIKDDNSSNGITEYIYGENGNGHGYVSYVPFAQNISKEVSYSSQLPAPRVMYEHVKAVSKNNNGDILGSVGYKFNIMKSKDPNAIKYGDFYEVIKTQSEHTNTAQNKKVNLASYTVKNNLAAIGQLLEVSTFNAKNQKMSKITNTYHDATSLGANNNMGLKKESFQSYKTIDYIDTNAQDKWHVNASTRITYPSIIKSSTQQSNGYTYTTEFNDYDLISGISKEQLHTSSDGKTYKTKVVPAYTKYPQMGSKVDNINNRNMLSQTAATYSFINEAGVDRVTGVGITTWNNIWSYQDVGGYISSPMADKEKIWRKHKSFTWNGDVDSNGLFPTTYNTTTDDGFVWGVGLPQTNAKWKQISEVTLYDHYSMPLEVKDINNNKAATKMDVLNQKVEANGNAAYNEMYYSGAEIFSGGGYWVGQEVRNSNGTRNDIKAHTGKFSIAATSSSEFGVYMRNGHRAGKYKLSVWVHKDNESKARVRATQYGSPTIFNGDNERVVAGDWVLKVHYFDVVAGDFYPYVTSSDSSQVYFDDLMIRPIASSITGYVYNEYDELTHIIGNNGLSTRFEYDAAGRLVKTYVEIVDDTANGVTGGFKLKSENKYNYKNL